MEDTFDQDCRGIERRVYEDMGYSVKGFLYIKPKEEIGKHFMVTFTSYRNM